MQKILFLLFIGFVSLSSLSAQNTVEWLTWEEAMEKNKKEPRKIMVDVYTDWCGWCKKMEKVTFNADMIADYLNNNFYPVKFDAERKKSISHKGEDYKFVRSGRNGYHEFAAELLRGKLSFPTVVFLDENSDIIQPIPGFQDAQTFEMIIKYFAEDHFKNIPWPKYTLNYEQQKPQATPVKSSN